MDDYIIVSAPKSFRKWRQSPTTNPMELEIRRQMSKRKIGSFALIQMVNILLILDPKLLIA